LNVVALFFVLFHAVTWFNLAPQAMVVRLRGKRVPGARIVALNYLALAVLSAVIVWVILA
jgi:fumarate reductase subunit C